MSTYKINGVEYPSVTTILGVVNKQGLYKWYADNGWDKCKKIQDESMAYGSYIHKKIKTYLDTNSPPKCRDKASQALLDAFVKWIKDKKLRPVMSEQQIFSKTYGYAGTLDLYGVIDDTAVIVDYKVAKKIYPEYKMQLVAYTMALMDMDIIKPKKLIILRFDKEKKKLYEVEVKDIKRWWNGFHGALVLYKSLRSNKKK